MANAIDFKESTGKERHMSNYTRRDILLAAVTGTIYTAFSPIWVLAADPCSVQHPLMPPRKDFSGQCPNCGMGRAMWARTWLTFENSEGKSQACSFHCLSDVALKSGEDPKNVQVAHYLNPNTMIPAQQAFFVVGSKAKGTMTMTSKIALASKAEAENFAGSCGGEVVGYRQALTMAKAGIAKENPMLLDKRLKIGVIVEPVDDKDHCAVCNMYPARYPRHKSQIFAQRKKTFHFCSTQCLFEFLGHSRKYVQTDIGPFQIWVTDFPTGAWTGGRTAYYVVGSEKLGPMGHEAIAFDKKKAADDFARKEGGKVLTFSHVAIETFNPK
jgi:nitrous oxide reductase accessory protein NosL